MSCPTAIPHRVCASTATWSASQMVASHHPELPAQLGDEAWRALIEDFVRQSTWTSHFYGDLHDEFIAYLERTRAQAD